MGKQGKIDDFRRPLQKSPADSDGRPGVDQPYENDADYERAKKKLAAELQREKLKKQLVRRARIKRAKRLYRRAIDGIKKSPAKLLAIARHPDHRKKLLITASGGIAIAALLYIFAWQQSNPQVLGDDLPSTPTFDTLVPNNDIANTTSGKIGYDRQRQVVSFMDEIDGVTITLSQQPLPERFQGNMGGSELEMFARELGATEKLKAGGTTAYSSLSSTGRQRVVFVKNQVLVFIIANEELDNKALSRYLNSLR